MTRTIFNNKFQYSLGCVLSAGIFATLFPLAHADSFTDTQADATTTINISNQSLTQSPSSTYQTNLSDAEIARLVAPIALYPDALLSQVLMASTYPLEVVEAYRWSQANAGLQGDDAVIAAKQNAWDPSVLSLTAFPQILGMMNQKLDLMQQLGNAFVGQQSQVLMVVQQLRHQAQVAGNLQSNDQVHVYSQGQMIMIEPTSPQLVYVPYYDPTIVYGAWTWSNYPPVVWDPWPGSYIRSSYSPSFYYSRAIVLRQGFFFGNCDWHRHQVNVVNINNYYYRNALMQHTPNASQAIQQTPQAITQNGGFVWQHDAGHRFGMPDQRMQPQSVSTQTPAQIVSVPQISNVITTSPALRTVQPQPLQAITQPVARNAPGSPIVPNFIQNGSKPQAAIAHMPSIQPQNMMPSQIMDQRPRVAQFHPVDNHTSPTNREPPHVQMNQIKIVRPQQNGHHG